MLSDDLIIVAVDGGGRGSSGVCGWGGGGVSCSSCVQDGAGSNQMG